MGVFSVFLSGKVDKAQQGLVEQIQNRTKSSEEQARLQRAEEEQQRRRQQQEQATFSKQLSLWDQLAPDLYGIRCYALSLPGCAELGPADVLSRKQRCDTLMNAYRDFLPVSVVSAYEAFSDSVFAISKDPSAPVMLRLSYSDHPKVKKKPEKRLFSYGKDSEAAHAQRKSIGEKWEALRQAISKMLVNPA